MVRDAPQAALLTMEVCHFAAKQALVLRNSPEASVSKDGRERDRRPSFFPYAIALPCGQGGMIRRSAIMPGEGSASAETVELVETNPSPKRT